MKRKVICHRLKIFLGLLLFASVSWSMATVLNANIDRKQVGIDESFHLSLRLDDATNAVPNLTPLKQDFIILSTSKSSQFSIINGKATSQTQWTIGLAPKHSGLLQIPAIHVGTYASNPLSINVSTASSLASSTTTVNKKQAGQAFQDIFMKVSTSPKTIYVGNQLLYRVRIFSDTDIFQPLLTAPIADNATIRLLGKGAYYEAKRNQRTYQVSEKDFVIIPNHAGTITIRAPVLNGRLPMALNINSLNNNNLNSLFSNSLVGLNGKPVHVSAKPIQIMVHAIPNGIDPSTWLPTNKLRLTQSWSGDIHTWHVGDPLTRQVTILANGIAATQLPNIPMPSHHTDFNMYRDKGLADDSLQGDTLIGKRVEKFVVIPTHAGQLTLPAIQLPWWNTQTKTMQMATLPALRVTVLPALQTTGNASAQLKQPSRQTTSNTATSQTGSGTHDVHQAGKHTKNILEMLLHHSRAFMLAAIFFLLWVITLLAWIWQKQKVIKSQINTAQTLQSSQTVSTGVTMNVKKAWGVFRVACDRQDNHAIKDSLMIWADLKYAPVKIHSLHDLAIHLQDKTLTLDLMALDKALYAASPSRQFDSKGFYRRLSSYLKTHSKHKQITKKNALPPLYPENHY